MRSKKKCKKCGYEDENNKEISLNNQTICLCAICNHFAPKDDKRLREYIEENVNKSELESFRKYNKDSKKEAMERKARKGRVMSRAPFGYKIENKELIPESKDKLKVQRIFMDFVNKDISLNKLAKKYDFSVNGIKKILKNFTYIGKIKFSGQISQGNHKAIISPELFNKVQSKIENIERN